MITKDMNNPNTSKRTFLVVGLGNPEGKYFQTYHNLGFICAERLVEELGGAFRKNGNQLLAKVVKYKLEPQNPELCTADILILKPLTYMNLSGQAVLATARKYKITHENIIVFTDDLYIDKGNIRIVSGGSSAGHNGIKSISDLLKTNQYMRIKIGIKPEKPPHSLSDYVLKKIDTKSNILIENAVEKAITAAKMLISGEKLDKIQNLFNKTNNEEKTKPDTRIRR